VRCLEKPRVPYSSVHSEVGSVIPSNEHSDLLALRSHCTLSTSISANGRKRFRGSRFPERIRAASTIATFCPDSLGCLNTRLTRMRQLRRSANSHSAESLIKTRIRSNCAAECREKPLGTCTCAVCDNRCLCGLQANAHISSWRLLTLAIVLCECDGRSLGGGATRSDQKCLAAVAQRRRQQSADGYWHFKQR
jgi:hypothetical protein